MITAVVGAMLEDDHIGSHSQKIPNNRDLLAMTTAFAGSLSRDAESTPHYTPKALFVSSTLRKYA